MSLSDYKIILGEKGVFYSEEKVKEFIKDFKKEDVYELAKYIHDIYEAYSKKNGWETNKDCKVDFDFLPEKNKQVMINTALQIIVRMNKKIDKLVGKELLEEQGK